MDDIRMERIVCAVDFSKHSDYALGYAVALAKTFGAELKLLHVVELPFLPAYSLAGVPDLSIPVSQVEAAARKQMDEVLERCRQEWGKTEGEVRTGAPFIEIISYAKEVVADLIVLSTHGRTGLRHMLIGSVAEKVVRKAPCPVLSVKHPEHKFEMP
jgi:nucleotide-binding universal stress UspA family protein